MKKLLILFLIVILSLVSIPSVRAEENLVNIYFFHSNTCPHCKAEEKLLDELENEYDNIEIYRYEISSEENSKILQEASKLYDFNVTGTPITIIGSKIYFGYSDTNSKEKFKGTIEYFSKYGYEDLLGQYLNLELPSYEIEKNSISLEDYLSDYGNYKLDIPLVGEVETKTLTLPLIAIVMGLLDGFNPCAMWVLLFLISMLIGIDDKVRMWSLGLAFLITSAIIYLFIMLAWLNVAKIITAITWVRLIIALIALIGGIINLRSYINTKKDGCEVVSDNKRNKIFNKIKKFTCEKNFILALFGVITLAISVNIIELACSAGIPVMFVEILSLNNLSTFEVGVYIFLYILFFLIDDLVVFFIAMITLKLTGISTKYSKLSKLIGGIMLVIIGILLALKPEWLMFNF